MMMIDSSGALAWQVHRNVARTLAVLAMAVVVWASALGAQVPDVTGSPEAAWTPGEESDIEVRRHFAALWGLEDRDILIEWGTLPRGRSAQSGPIRFAGSGNGGFWIAYFESESGSDFGVRIKIGAPARSWTATHRLPRGRSLTLEDMTRVETPRWGVPDQAELTVAEGWVTARLIEAGEELVAPAVAPPIVVTAGTAVQAVWQTANLRLSMVGTAMRHGRLGDVIDVRLESRRTVTGTVKGPGLVEIEGGSR